MLGLWVQNTRGGWIVFLKVVVNFSQSVSSPDLADWSWLGRM